MPHDTERSLEQCGPIRAERERRWLQENQDAFAQYNRRVAEQGLLSDDAGLL